MHLVHFIHRFFWIKSTSFSLLHWTHIMPYLWLFYSFTNFLSFWVVKLFTEKNYFFFSSASHNRHPGLCSEWEEESNSIHLRLEFKTCSMNTILEEGMEKRDTHPSAQFSLFLSVLWNPGVHIWSRREKLFLVGNCCETFLLMGSIIPPFQAKGHVKYPEHILSLE